MSRAGWIVTLMLALALMILPGFLERYRRVRRALGAACVFWVSLNLWGTSLHFAGLRAEGPLRAAALAGPPLLATVLWLYWPGRRRQGT